MEEQPDSAQFKNCLSPDRTVIVLPEALFQDQHPSLPKNFNDGKTYDGKSIIMAQCNENHAVRVRLLQKLNENL